MIKYKRPANYKKASAKFNLILVGKVSRNKQKFQIFVRRCKDNKLRLHSPFFYLVFSFGMFCSFFLKFR